MPIKQYIECCQCGGIGASYTGFNAMATLTAKKELQLNEWSFRDDLKNDNDNDVGHVLCPTCFRKKGDEKTLISYTHTNIEVGKVVDSSRWPAVSTKLNEDGCVINYVKQMPDGGKEN